MTPKPTAQTEYLPRYQASCDFIWLAPGGCAMLPPVIKKETTVSQFSTLQLDAATANGQPRNPSFPHRRPGRPTYGPPSPHSRDQVARARNRR